MPATAYFSPEAFTFLRQLKRHNDREWFAKNKTRYQASNCRACALIYQRLRPSSVRNQFVLCRRCATQPRLTVPYLSGHPLLCRQAAIQNTCWYSFLSCQRQGCSCPCLLSASRTGQLLRRSGYLASRQSRANQSAHRYCARRQAVGHGLRKTDTRGREAGEAAARV